MTIKFARAILADAEALLRVQMAAFHHDAQLYPSVEIGGPPGYDSLAVMLEKVQQDECYKIVEEGRLIGGMVVFDESGGHYHLDLIFIDPAHHNRGIGTQAMRFLEQTYPALRWTLDTPTWATRNQHFYEKLGYVKVGEGDFDGIPIIHYEKRPSPTSKT